MEPEDSETDDKTNICPLCMRGFETLAGLKQHWSKSHSDEEIKSAVAEANNQQSSEFTTHHNGIQIIRNDSNVGLTYQQFNIIENGGAGECLFLSVLEFLKNNVNHSNAVPTDTSELRRMTVNYILSLSSDGLELNFDRFRDSIIINLRRHIPELTKVLEQDDSNEAIQIAYLNHMSSHGSYGTATELCALSELFGFEFYVIQQISPTDFSCFDYGSEYNSIGNGNAMFLLFTGSPDTGHFRLLTPVNAISHAVISPGDYKLVADHTSSRMTSIASVSDYAELPVEQPTDNQNTSTAASQTEGGTGLEEFLVMLSRCKRNIKVIKRIPRAARISAALKLAECINKCLTHPDIDKNWQNLLTFAYTALKVPTRTKKFSLTTLIKKNIENGELVIPKPAKKYVPISISRRVEYKISDGDVKGAVKLLSSTDTIAPFNELTLEQLEKKHPPPTEEIPLPEPPDKNIEPLAVSEKEVYKMIGKFPNGSSAGIDGILPQHLKDLTSPITGEAGLILLRAITKLSNFMLAGKIPSTLCAITYGASLCALNKKEGGIRPIAVGNTFRRLAAKLSCASVRSESSEKFAPRQVGFGVPGGCEASVHATRTFIKKHKHSKAVVLKIDFRNAFNEVQRAKFLEEIKVNHPSIYPFLWQCYSTTSFLFYGDNIILSQNGAQQGDPCGPLLFCLAIQSVITALISEFVIFYLDDGTIAGNPDTVLQDFVVVIEECKKLGLMVNPSKCELYFCSQVDANVVQLFEAISPGIIIVNDLTLLGAPISSHSFEMVFKKKLQELKIFFKRLTELDSYHIAYYILRNCLSIPKLVFLLRTTPSWKPSEVLKEIDDNIRTTVETLTNTQLDTDTWISSSLPIRFGGLGVRRVQDIALPAFLSSVNSLFPLMSIMLQSPTLDIMEIADYEDGLTAWNCINPDSNPPVTPALQKDWDSINVQRMVYCLQSDQPAENARRLAICERESGAWLHALPSRALGTLLDNNVFRICVGLRLGSDICKPHTCGCGTLVDKKGRHGLHCRKSAGRWPRHVDLNQTIKRSLASADIPAKLEPVGLIRTDGRRVDGMSLIPWSKGKTLIWDATCADTFAPSILNRTSKEVGQAAANMVRVKEHTYAPLLSQNYHFVPFAVETMGPWCKEAKNFFNQLAKQISIKTHEPRAKSFLEQRISMAIQKGNAASVMGTFQDCEKMEEIFLL